MKLGHRIRSRREEIGMKGADLARRTGVSRATVTNWEKGEHDPDIDKLPAIARALQTTVSWLMDEAGAKSGGAVRDTGGQASWLRVPLVDSVQAGKWASPAEPYPAGTEFLSVDFTVSPASFALEIAGDSMAPEFIAGDRIIIDPNIVPRPGDCVVARNGGHEATFKKFRPRGINERGEPVFELVPLNPDYPSMRSDREQIEIIGVMVEHRRRRRK